MHRPTLFPQGIDGESEEYHHPLDVCSVDLHKAYDSVNRRTLWSVRQHCYHLPPKFLTIVKALHENTAAAVRSNGRISEQFPISVGVKQVNLFFDAI